MYALRGLLARREKMVPKALAYLGRAVKLAPHEARWVVGGCSWLVVGGLAGGWRAVCRWLAGSNMHRLICPWLCVIRCCGMPA